MYLQSTSCGEIGLILHEILFKILGYKQDGTFIEVGANDGFTGSFTYNLAKIGWKGIYFEPVPSIYKICVKNHENHDNVKVVNIAVGEKEEYLYIVDGGTLSTMDNETYNIYLNTNWSKNNFKSNEKIRVKTDNLDNILTKHAVEKDFDLLVLDVEGYEMNVLKGFTIAKYNPKIVIIEISDQHESFKNNRVIMEKFTWIRNYLFENNYTLLVNDIVDNVYVRSDLYLDKDKQFFSSKIKFPQFNK